MNSIPKVKILPRSANKADWEAVNPILLNGELVIEIDTKKFKRGDGVTVYIEVPYFSSVDEELLSQISAINNKVDKVTGKGLSTNDYTTAEKNKLASLSTEVSSLVVPEYADNDDAIAGGLTTGKLYHTAGSVKVVTSTTSNELPNVGDVWDGGIVSAVNSQTRNIIIVMKEVAPSANIMVIPGGNLTLSHENTISNISYLKQSLTYNAGKTDWRLATSKEALEICTYVRSKLVAGGNKPDLDTWWTCTYQNPGSYNGMMRGISYNGTSYTENSYPTVATFNSIAIRTVNLSMQGVITPIENYFANVGDFYAGGYIADIDSNGLATVVLGDEVLIYGIDAGNKIYQDAFNFADGYEIVDTPYDDWRLPTKTEALSIVHFVVGMAITRNQMWLGELPPYANADAYEQTFWTSTIDEPETHFVVNSNNGVTAAFTTLWDTEQSFCFAIRKETL